MTRSAQAKRGPRGAGSRVLGEPVEFQSAMSIWCRVAEDRWTADTCSQRGETNDRRRYTCPRCNAPQIRARPLPPQPVQRHPLLPERQDVQARQALAAQLERRSSCSAPGTRLAGAQLAQAQAARRRAGLPAYQPWETSEPEAGPAPATRCQEQSPAPRRKPLAASLRPLRHDTTGAIDGPIRFAIVPRVNLARRALKEVNNHATFCENARPAPA